MHSSSPHNSYKGGHSPRSLPYFSSHRIGLNRGSIKAQFSLLQMVGSGKGKHKKHQGKSIDHKSNPVNREHGTSSSNFDMGKLPSVNIDKTVTDGDKKIPPILKQNCGTSSTAASANRTVTFAADPQVNAPNPTTNESPVDSHELDDLDFIKSLTNCPNEMDLEEWLATCSEDSKGCLIVNFLKKVDCLSTQVQEMRECAKETIIERAKRFNDNKIELRNMRLQNNERECLSKQKEELDNLNSMLTEKENSLRMAYREIDCVDQAIKIIDSHDQEIQATNEVQKFCTSSEYKEALSLAQKWDREVLKMSKETEKQISEVKRHFAEERRKVVELEEKLKQYYEDYEHDKATPSYGW